MTHQTMPNHVKVCPTPPAARRDTLYKQAICGLLTVPLLALTHTASAASYSILELGTLGGRYSGAGGIDASGQVTGYSETMTGQVHAFLWRKGVMADLGTLGSNYSEGRAINASGQVVGYSAPSSGPYEGFLFNGRKMLALPTSGGSWAGADGINDFGQVVGGAVTRSGGSHAFLYSGGVMTDLGTLGGIGSQAWAINAAGAVVGQAAIADGSYRAFLKRAGQPLIDLGTFGRPAQNLDESVAYGINAVGQVVGYAATPSGAHAFRTARYRAIDPAADDLGTLGGPESIAFGINAAGQVVGWAATPLPLSETHAFLYSHGRMWDLNTLIPSGSGWLLVHALAINDAGQIVGRGVHDGLEQAFLLTPSSGSR